MAPSLLELPSECLLAVLERLAVEDILSLGSTSRAACELAQNDGLWRSLAARKWGPAALTLRAEDAGAWKPWCCKRMSLKRSRWATSSRLSHAGQLPQSWVVHSPCCRMPPLALHMVQLALMHELLVACRPSPLSLLQESYLDPWQHIVACVLCRCVECSDAFEFLHCKSPISVTSPHHSASGLSLVAN